MARIKLWGSLRSLVDGREYLEVEAKSLKGVIEALERDVPQLRPQLERGVSFSVDGLVYQDSIFVSIEDAKEIVMMPRMVGG